MAGYQFVRRDRNGRAGAGVAIYFKDHLTCAQITKYEVPDFEAIWIEVISISQRLLVGCVYRPPDFSEFFGKFRCVVEKNVDI